MRLSQIHRAHIFDLVVITNASAHLVNPKLMIGSSLKSKRIKRKCIGARSIVKWPLKIWKPCIRRRGTCPPMVLSYEELPSRTHDRCLRGCGPWRSLICLYTILRLSNQLDCSTWAVAANRSGQVPGHHCKEAQGLKFARNWQTARGENNEEDFKISSNEHDTDTHFHS